MIYRVVAKVMSQRCQKMDFCIRRVLNMRFQQVSEILPVSLIAHSLRNFITFYSCSMIFGRMKCR